MECTYTGLAKLSKKFYHIGGLHDMSVGLGKAREIIHFEDIVCEMSLLTHSLGGADLLLNHLFTVSHLVMISDTIIM